MYHFYVDTLTKHEIDKSECLTTFTLLIQLQAAGKSGRFPRHFKDNDIIKRAVGLAGFPAKLEPSGLSKDGSKKHPDGYTYESFKTGKPLVWDFICSDTLAPSHIDKYSMEAGKTAAWAEDNMFTTYGNALRDDYID